MAFSATDIYTASGSAFLYNSWTPNVTKFDTSTFYNWEQDNEPIYDLEERTYELWEKAGFPTSAVPGMVLTVSGDATPDDLLNNTNLFTSVSACMAAIPEVVRFPIFIEVGSFGDIGKLELHNVKCVENGSIEIINRGFVKSYKDNVGTLYRETNNGFRPLYALADSDFSNTLNDTSCIGISTNLLSATLPVVDGRLSDDPGYFVFSQPHSDREIQTGYVVQGANWAGIGANIVGGTNVYEVAGSDSTVLTLDSSSVDAYTGTDLTQRLDNYAGANGGVGMFYTNYLSSISIKNCEGPIYIRNFCVDGQAGVGTGVDHGITIFNSDVVLENYNVVRCNKSGIKADGSNVVLSRSGSVYRIYERDSSTTRVAEQGWGLDAHNSTITVSGGQDIQAAGDDYFFTFQKSYGGVRLSNSKLVGGFERTVFSDEASGGSFSPIHNTGYGLMAVNSEVDLVGLLDFYNNYKGVKLDNSKFRFQQLCVEGTSKEGLHATGSTILWDGGKSFGEAGQLTRRQIDFLQNGQDVVLKGGSKFTFEHETDMPDVYGHTSFVSGMGRLDLSGSTRALPSIVVEDNSKARLLHTKIDPRGQDTVHLEANQSVFGLAAKVSDNSELDFYGTGSGCTFIAGVPSFSHQQKVAGLYADNGSKIGLHGPTVISQFGVDVLVNNNSILDMSPPKSEYSDAYDMSGFGLTDTKNHTSIELHSTRSCLVADNNSVIRAKDLGDYANFWDDDRIATAGYRSDDLGLSALVSHGSLQFFPNPQDETLCTSGNGTESVISVPEFPKHTPQTKTNQFILADDVLTTPSFGDISDTTLGGMCVRALGDSVVDVDNVHFPIGTENNALNKAYFDASGDTCHRLMIWNIADTSKLKASHTSVSGTYPGEAGYYGPSALWQDSGSIASGAPAGTPDTGVLSVLDTYGAGSGVFTPQPGISIHEPFDRFYPYNASDAGIHEEIADGGLVVSSTTSNYLYGASALGVQANQGVFRLYFSVAPEAKYLTHADSDEVGIPYQLFAQGYNCSGNLSAINLDGVADSLAVSALAQNLLKFSDDTDGDSIPDALATSGFYYCKDFVEDDPTQCTLDESASDTFANAKNCALGTSGRPKKVTIYRSRLSTDRSSDAYPGDAIAGVHSVNVFDLERDN